MATRKPRTSRQHAETPQVGAVWALPGEHVLTADEVRAAAMEAVKALTDRRQWVLYGGSDGEASDD